MDITILCKQASQTVQLFGVYSTCIKIKILANKGNTVSTKITQINQNIQKYCHLFAIFFFKIHCHRTARQTARNPNIPFDTIVCRQFRGAE